MSEVCIEETENRINLLGVSYVAGLADEELFRDDPISRSIRRTLYQGLPKNLTDNEVYSLGQEIRSLTLTDRPFLESPSRNSVRALKWLGSMSYLHGDDVTRQSVVEVLKSGNGLRGKLAAIALWTEQQFA